MKVTSALLQKYVSGQCTADEIKEVERWLSSNEDDAVLSAKEIGASPATIQTKLYASLFEESVATVPLYRKFIQYAAAACIIFVAFFGGRLTANTATADAIKENHPKDQLYISGGKGAKGNLPGNSFKIGFDGVLRLYNNSHNQKSIHVGSSTFLLEPNQFYYLIGSTKAPKLINNDDYTDDQYQRSVLEGDFSILRLDSK